MRNLAIIFHTLTYLIDIPVSNHSSIPTITLISAQIPYMAPRWTPSQVEAHFTPLRFWHPMWMSSSPHLGWHPEWGQPRIGLFTWPCAPPHHILTLLGLMLRNSHFPTSIYRDTLFTLPRFRKSALGHHTPHPSSRPSHLPCSAHLKPLGPNQWGKGGLPQTLVFI